MVNNWLIVGIGGCTCSGKSTLAAAIQSLIPCSVHLLQDDFFLDVDSDKHVKIPELNHINFEIVSSLDNNAFLGKIEDVLHTDTVINAPTPFQLSQYIPKSVTSIPPVLLLDGFLLFNEPRLAELCDIKICVTLDKETCWERRRARVYGPPDPPGYFQQIVWPYYEKHLEEVKSKVQNVFYLNGSESPEEILRKSLAIIFNRL